MYVYNGTSSSSGYLRVFISLIRVRCVYYLFTFDLCMVCVGRCDVPGSYYI